MSQTYETPSENQRSLTLRKGNEYFLFRYHTGREAEVLRAIMEAASNSNTSFDVTDAAVLAYQLGRQNSNKDNF